MNLELERAKQLLKDAENNILQARQIMLRESPEAVSTRAGKAQMKHIDVCANKVADAMDLWYDTDFLRPLKWK